MVGVLGAPAGADSHATGGAGGAPPVAAEPDPGEPRVARAQFTSAVVDREPTDSLTRIDGETTRVFFFTELLGFQGQDVVHRWERGGDVEAEVPFGVGGPRWRVYSSKEIDPDAAGEWTVTVIDAEGRVVARKTLERTRPDEPIQPRAQNAPTDPAAAAPAAPVP